MSTLRWYSYFLLALIVPSLCSPTAPGYSSPSLHQLDGRNSSRFTFVVSSWKLDANARRPRTNANNEFVDLGVGRTRSRIDIEKNKHGISFSNVWLRKMDNVIMFSDMRGGADESNPIEGAGVDDNAKARGISRSLFVTYLTVMGAKCALPSTLAMLASANSGLAHHNTVLSRQDIISRLLVISTLSIAAGKLFLGPVIDSLGGVLSLQMALSVLFVCLSSIGLGARTCPTLTALAAYWIVVDFAFSSCWAACVKTIRDHLSEGRWSREIGRLAMAARMGNAISFAFFAWLLQWASAGTLAARSAGATQVDASWRWVFRASGAVQLMPLLMLSYFGKKRGRSNNISNKEEQSTSMSKSTLKDSLAILTQQSRTLEFWLHLVSRSIIMVLVSFLLFIPSYMTQCYEMSSASSARVGSMFALGCLLSVSTLAERAYPSIASNSNTGIFRSISSSQRKAYFMLAFLGLATICLGFQATFLQNLFNLSPILGAFLMFLLGFSLAIPFYLPSSIFALKRGGKDGSATIADAFDVCGFGLLAVFNGIVARVLDVSDEVWSAGILLGRKRAWLPVFLWMIGGSILAMASLFGAIWLEEER